MTWHKPQQHIWPPPAGLLCCWQQLCQPDISAQGSDIQPKRCHSFRTLAPCRTRWRLRSSTSALTWARATRTRPAAASWQLAMQAATLCRALPPSTSWHTVWPTLNLPGHGCAVTQGCSVFLYGLCLRSLSSAHSGCLHGAHLHGLRPACMVHALDGRLHCLCLQFLGHLHARPSM